MRDRERVFLGMGGAWVGGFCGESGGVEPGVDEEIAGLVLLSQQLILSIMDDRGGGEVVQRKSMFAFER